MQFDEGTHEYRVYKREVKFVFDAVDVDKSGVIDKEEFLEAVKTNEAVKRLVKNSRVLSRLVALDEFDNAFSSIDADGGGSVNFEEFWHFCKTEADEQRIRKIFASIDKDGNRYLTKQELVQAFTTNEEVMAMLRESSTLSSLVDAGNYDEALASLDRDKSGRSENKIDFPEFWKFCKTCAAKAQINKAKENAARRRKQINEEKKKRLDELLGRLNSHTQRGAKGGYSASVLPEGKNYEVLDDGPNPFARRGKATGKLKNIKWIS